MLGAHHSYKIGEQQHRNRYVILFGRLHAQDLEKLREEMQRLRAAAKKMQHLQTAAKQQRVVDIQRITNELNESSGAELEKEGKVEENTKKINELKHLISSLQGKMNL